MDSDSEVPSFRQRSSSSIAWSHFEVLDSERRVATCNICHEKYSYKTSVTNLIKHLKCKHKECLNIEFIKVVDDEGNELETEVKSSPIDKRRLPKSGIWEYFEKVDELEKSASCNLCSQKLSYKTTITNLAKHLSRRHDVVQFKDDEIKTDDKSTDCESDEELEGKDETKSQFRLRSSAWRFFEVQDAERKMARCNICSELYSYKASVSNLTKHVKNVHRISIDDGDSEGGFATPRSGHRSIVWLYFKCIDPESKVSQCLICKKLLSHSTSVSNLKKHLDRRHPNATIPEREDGQKRILLSSGGELYEVETLKEENGLESQNETLDMDAVYLEDFDDVEQPVKKRRKGSKRRVSESSSEGDNKRSTDSCDHFGKYIVSLLKQLPKHVSNRLQSDFVRQIMDASASLENLETIVNVDDGSGVEKEMEGRLN